MKAVIFARVSSIEQKDNNSLDAQIFKMKEYCNRKKFEIIKEIKLVESSTRGEREQFYEMIDFIKHQKEKIVVLTYNTDRLQRDFDEQSLELRGLVNQDKAEIHFVSTKQKITKEADSSTKFKD